MSTGPRTALGPIVVPTEAEAPPVDAGSVQDYTYIDAEVRRLEEGGEPPPYWRAFHWGLYDDPMDQDNTLDGYVRAGEQMTEHVVAAAGVTDGARVLDVGCGFGGTVDHVRARQRDVWAVGLNIDERQVRAARQLLVTHGRGPAGPVPFITADGCRLPVADASFDHILAVECIFHFPSRKQFFKEVARVLRPGGTLALSDFLFAPKALTTLSAANDGSFQKQAYYGHSTRPLTEAGYGRLARSVGLDPVLVDNVSDRTMPTYGALRMIYSLQGMADGVAAVDASEWLARSGAWLYHVLSFRKGPARPT
jgi:ubiquinone/menaquinone biosynthesis C-methylase UbiE